MLVGCENDLYSWLPRLQHLVFEFRLLAEDMTFKGILELDICNPPTLFILWAVTENDPVSAGFCCTENSDDF